jgi:hypothetical protein
MNEQNLNQFLNAARQYLFGQVSSKNLISADNSALVH